MPSLVALWTFARSSVFAALLVVGALVLAGAALVGTSMLSVGHLVGSGLAGVGLIGLASRQRLDGITWRPSRAVFLALFCWVAAGYAVQVWAHYWAGAFSLWDVGIFADLLSSLALRDTYWSSPLGVHGFADHFTPTLTLLTPLFNWTPSFMWLIGAKVVAMLVCAPLLHLIGREVLGKGSRWLWVMPCLWLVHTLCAFGVLFQFQPTHLAPPLALGAFLLALRQRWVWLCVCLLLLAGLKEDMALVGMCVGMFLAVERRRPRIGAALIVASIAIGLTIVLVVMPIFADGAPVLQHSRFNPLAFWPQKLFVVLVLLASVGLLPLFHPRSLWWILGAFSVHFVSGFEHMFGFRYHYHLVPLALLFVASIYGIAAIQNGTGPLVRIGGRWRSLSIAAAVALVLSLNGMLPLFSARLSWPTPTSRAIVSEVVAIESQLPADYAVYATHELVPYLVPHARLRQFNGKPQRHSGSFFDTSEPHVVVLTTEPLALALPDRPVLELMDEYAAKNGYRVEMPSPHLRLYWSTATP